MFAHFLLWKWRTVRRALITQPPLHKRPAPQTSSTEPEALHDVSISQGELGYSSAEDLCDGGPLEHTAVIK